MPPDDDAVKAAAVVAVHRSDAGDEEPLSDKKVCDTALSSLIDTVTERLSEYSDYTTDDSGLRRARYSTSFSEFRSIVEYAL